MADHMHGKANARSHVEEPIEDHRLNEQFADHMLKNLQTTC
jgi:hypothetical protein